jgi:hypothetical protein
MTTKLDEPHEYRGISIKAYRPYFAHPRMPRANIRFIAKSESFVAWSDSWPKLKKHIDKWLDGGVHQDCQHETDPAE